MGLTVQSCSCNMTFCYFFEVLLELNPIQANNFSKEVLQNENNQGGGIINESPYNNLPILEVTIQFLSEYSVILQVS